MNKIAIGRMAAVNQITVQTLRHYDKIGLLKPAYTDPGTNYRYYDIKQSAKLDMISYMKFLGMSLESVKEQFDKKDIDEICFILDKQKAVFEEKIKELRRMQRAVNTCFNNFERYKKAPDDGQITLEQINERTIFCYNTHKNIYDHTLDGYEYILRELKRQIIQQHLPIVYFCNVGSIIRKQDLDAGRFVSTEIFLFVDELFEQDKGREVIPANDYACIYCDGFSKEREYADRLLRYIRQKNYTILGDYVCEVVVELPVFHFDQRNMFIRLQVPVKTS